MVVGGGGSGGQKRVRKEGSRTYVKDKVPEWRFGNIGPEWRTYGMRPDEHRHYGVQHATAACSRTVLPFENTCRASVV